MLKAKVPTSAFSIYPLAFVRREFSTYHRSWRGRGWVFRGDHLRGDVAKLRSHASGERAAVPVESTDFRRRALQCHARVLRPARIGQALSTRGTGTHLDLQPLSGERHRGLV